MKPLIVIILALTLGSSVRAEEQNTSVRDEGLKQYQRLADQMLDREIAPRLWAALGAEERRALASTRVTVVFDPNPYRIGLAQSSTSSLSDLTVNER